MFCTSCGAQLEEGMKFCTSCGAPVEKKEDPTYVVPVPQSGNSLSVPAASELTPSNVLTWGIVAAAFACTFFLSFLGIIFGSIALKKADSYIAMHGPISTQVKVGHILSKVGIIAGIILTILCVLYFLFIIIIVANS